MKMLITLMIVLALAACASTPEITPSEQRDIAKEEMTDVYDFKPSGPMSLNAVISNVILRNQDVWTKEYELQVAEGDKLLANLEYLPKLTATLNQKNRDRLLLTTSARLGEEPIEGVDTIPSYSAPTDVRTESIRLHWDLTQLWLNFLTSKQKGNAHWIAKLNRERAMQNIFRDVFPAYDLTTINQAEGVELANLKRNIKDNIDRICVSIVEEAVLNDVLASNCTSALSNHSTAVDLLASLKEADLNLHALMAVHPDVEIPLQQPMISDPGPLLWDTDRLIDFAVANRPELGVEIYKQRNSKIEKTKAWARCPSQC